MDQHALCCLGLGDVDIKCCAHIDRLHMSKTGRLPRWIISASQHPCPAANVAEYLRAHVSSQAQRRQWKCEAMGAEGWQLVAATLRPLWIARRCLWSGGRSPKQCRCPLRRHLRALMKRVSWITATPLSRCTQRCASQSHCTPPLPPALPQCSSPAALSFSLLRAQPPMALPIISSICFLTPVPSSPAHSTPTKHTRCCGQSREPAREHHRQQMPHHLHHQQARQHEYLEEGSPHHPNATSPPSDVRLGLRPVRAVWAVHNWERMFGLG